MWMAIRFDLKHVDEQTADAEAARLLTELAATIRAKGATVGDAHIMRDANGNRVGVADVFLDRK